MRQAVLSNTFEVPQRIDMSQKSYARRGGCSVTAQIRPLKAWRGRWEQDKPHSRQPPEACRHGQDRLRVLWGWKYVLERSAQSDPWVRLWTAKEEDQANREAKPRQDSFEDPPKLTIWYQFAEYRWDLAPEETQTLILDGEKRPGGLGLEGSKGSAAKALSDTGLRQTLPHAPGTAGHSCGHITAEEVKRHPGCTPP
ncbi:hypothetical protein AVEN_272675-1 [Araneus ventricosus]|uniref:Uncharacterized protein n=1 Tax=Araneus ventricosus TaxID=182803 RepID=A0A4Y2NQP2_ARAVE|nr:hypothetical protein AVEN_272675-1 [Araneus ventricosus]